MSFHATIHPKQIFSSKCEKKCFGLHVEEKILQDIETCFNVVGDWTK